MPPDYGSRPPRVTSETVRDHLRSAFACVRLPSVERQADLDDYRFREETRDSLFLYFDDLEYQYVLPLILIDMLERNYTDGLAGFEDGCVLTHLDVPTTGKSKSRYLKRYANFSVEQARAIAEWLCLVETWPEFRLEQTSIVSARRYWLRRTRGTLGERLRRLRSLFGPKRKG